MNWRTLRRGRHHRRMTGPAGKNAESFHLLRREGDLAPDAGLACITRDSVTVFSTTGANVAYSVVYGGDGIPRQPVGFVLWSV